MILLEIESEGMMAGSPGISKDPATVQPVPRSILVALSGTMMTIPQRAPTRILTLSMNSNSRLQYI